MNSANDISEELSSMGSSLAGLSRGMPYYVPHGYFSDISDQLLLTIKDLNEPEATPAWGKSLPYSVPSGYFEALTGQIVTIATSNEEISELPKKNPYITPAGYFETLPAHLLMAAKATDATTKEKIKNIPLKRTYKLWPARWAAAAVLLITISIGSYMVFEPQPGSTDKILASVPNNEIEDYLQGAYRVDMDRIVGNNEVSNLPLENKDIIEYLNETGWD